MQKLSDYEILALNKLGESIHSGRWSNEGLVQLIELVGNYLGLKTIPKYQKSTGLSYNGVKYHRTIRKIFDVKFVIDND
jgi:hypothetical protein